MTQGRFIAFSRSWVQITARSIFLKCKDLFKKKSDNCVQLTEKEIETLRRELEESRKSAMLSDTSSNAFGGGNYVTSKLRLAVNQNGLLGIVSRRIFEPRKNLSPENREEI